MLLFFVIADQGTGENVMESDSEFESESEYESDSSLEFSARPSQPKEPLKFSQLFRWVLILILTWHIAHSISATAINEMLQFLAAAFSVTEGLVSCSAAVGLSAFPASLYLAYKFLSVDTDNFSKYVLFPKCHRLYDYDEMLQPNPDGSLSIKRCT